MRVHGIDFTSAPCRRKPITVAVGRASAAEAGAVRVERIDRLESFGGFEAFLATPGPWVGGFDFPFGHARELVEALGWPRDWASMVRHVERLPRAAMVAAFKAFCDARPAGGKFAHRACDGPAGASPSMKWINPPVALMLQAGAPRLLAAGVDIPLLHDGDPGRVALEAYPGMLARAIVGRGSYKSDDPAKQDAARRRQREAIVAALGEGRHPMRLMVAMGARVRAECVDDGSGDCLDAVLCLVQAAWAQARRADNWGLPTDVDPIEGWIVGA